MAILLNEEIRTGNALVYTHEDQFGRGGYVAIATGITNAVPTSSAINAQVPTSRAKTGMLVFDSSSGYYFRCTNAASPATWIQVFTASLSEQYVEFGDLPQTPAGSGNIDLASQASVDAVASTCVRVKPDNTIQGLVAGSGVTLTPNYGSKTITVAASDNSTLNLSAIKVGHGTNAAAFNMTFAAAPVGNNTTDFWVLNVNPAVPSINQQASVVVTLNTNAINALAQ